LQVLLRLNSNKGTKSDIEIAAAARALSVVELAGFAKPQYRLTDSRSIQARGRYVAGTSPFEDIRHAPLGRWDDQNIGG
jgi:hypothetical protein